MATPRASYVDVGEAWRATIAAVLDPAFNSRPADLRVVLALSHQVASYSRLDDYVSLPALAERAGVSLRTLYRSLARLSAAGVIAYERGDKHRGGSRRRSRISLKQVTQPRHRSGAKTGAEPVSPVRAKPVTNRNGTGDKTVRELVTPDVTYNEKTSEKTSENNYCHEGAGTPDAMNLIASDSPVTTGAVMLMERLRAAIADGRRSWDLFEVAAAIWDECAPPTQLLPRIKFAIDYSRMLGAEEVDGARIGRLVKQFGKAALYGLEESISRDLRGDDLYRYAAACARRVVAEVAGA